MSQSNSERDEAAEKYHGQDRSNWGPDFVAGWDACMKHLLKSASEFDEAAAGLQAYKEFGDNGSSPVKAGIEMARWQFEQSRAREAALAEELKVFNYALRLTNETVAKRDKELSALREENSQLTNYKIGAEQHLKLLREELDSFQRSYGAVLDKLKLQLGEGM